jgi:flagellin-like protein
MVKREVQTNLLKMLKSKKGISPILATLLLIVIAVAAIVVTYAWVMTFMGAQTGAGGTILTVENMYWNSTAKTTNIDVKNIGTSDTKIVRLYIGETTSNLLEVTINTDLGTTGKNLPVDQKITIVLDWPNALGSSWTNGKMYYFKIVPETGTEREFTGKAPSV